MPSYQLDPDRAAPARLGRYELIGQLATGGMAEIHLARLAGEAGFEKIVVVKRLLPELVASPAFVAMFLDEGKLVARLDHPNVCEVHELGRDGAEYFLAMPYLDGVPVADLIARPRDPDRIGELRIAAGVIVQACAGLHHAHELRDADGAPAGLVHRDVSPSNLFVTASGVVKVLDFGVAKVRGAAETEAGTIKGKTGYMAPEQLLGESVDRRCDVFALGIVMYELATHQRLFKRASDYLTARAILEEPIPRADEADPAVPRDVADVIARALARDRNARFPDAAQFATALEDSMASRGQVANTTGVANTVSSTEELTAQRTRQARVLGQAKSKAVSLVATRMLRGEKTTLETKRVSARRNRPIVLAILVLALAVSVGIVLLQSRGGDTTAAVAAPRDASTLRVTPIEAGADTTAVVAAPRDASTLRVTPIEADAMPELVAAAPVDAAVRTIHDVTPARSPGKISIESTPYATIYIDGKRLDVTPIVGHTLPAGKHRVRAVLENGRSKELVVDVPAGRTANPIQLTW